MQTASKPAFHYRCFVRLIRNSASDKPEFITESKEFYNNSPIVARQAAFSYFQSYVDVLLQGAGKSYISDLQAREDLKPFYDQDGQSGYIAIIMVLDTVDAELLTFEPDELEIHAIPSNEIGTLDYLVGCLKEEYRLYQVCGYPANGIQREIQFFGDLDTFYQTSSSFAVTEVITILETPFDFSLYARPRKNVIAIDKYWQWSGFHDPEAKPVKRTHEGPTSSTLEELIARGETNQTEFKPCLLYNFQSGKKDDLIAHHSAKSICAFLNSNGGHLVIGVDDKGQVDGLSFDYSLAPKKKGPHDFFRLEFDQMIRRFFPSKVMRLLRTDIGCIGDKDVFVVTVWPSKEPIFLKNGHVKEFFVRAEASSNKVSDLEEFYNYCKTHFKRRQSRRQ